MSGASSEGMKRTNLFIDSHVQINDMIKPIPLCRQRKSVIQADWSIPPRRPLHFHPFISTFYEALSIKFSPFSLFLLLWNYWPINMHKFHPSWFQYCANRNSRWWNSILSLTPIWLSYHLHQNNHPATFNIIDNENTVTSMYAPCLNHKKSLILVFCLCQSLHSAHWAVCDSHILSNIMKSILIQRVKWLQKQNQSKSL